MPYPTPVPTLDPEPTPEPKPATGDPAPEPKPATGDPAPEPKPETDLAADVEKWKALARKNEERAKANAAAAKELEEVKKQNMTDTEKAVAEAKAAGRAEALKETGASLVEAEIKAAATGRGIDIDALLEGVDRSRFISEDGKADTAAVTAWVDKVAPQVADDGKPEIPDLGQGALGTSTDADAGLAAFARGAGLTPEKKG